MFASRLSKQAGCFSRNSRPLQRSFATVQLESTFQDSGIDASTLQNQLFIGGQFVNSLDCETMPTLDPRTGQVITKFATAGAADVDLAVTSARKAFDQGPWPRMGGFERSKLLWKLADAMEENFERLQRIESWDQGKPMADQSWLDVSLSIEQFRYFAGWADKLTGQTLSMNTLQGRYQSMTLHEPIGVAASITPWNFPLLMLAWKLAPALSVGCTCVLKPAETTPLSSLEFCRIAAEVGIPEGVINVVPGLGETAGAALAAHPSVDKVGFTGESSTGKLVMKAAAENLKPVTMELGGKSPMVICEDSDLDRAVQDLHVSMFWNAGQVCCAASRIFVHSSRYDEFVEKTVNLTKERKIGDPFSEGCNQGPMNNREQMDKVLKYIEKGKSSATLLCGGNQIGQQGYFVESTVFGDVSDDSEIAKDEIFGPVMQISKYDSFDEVIRRSNATNYGLASSIYSSDIDKVNRFTREIRAGTVWVNGYNVFAATLPFGGFKGSGFGREKGEYALHNFTSVKAVCTSLSPDNGPY